MQLKYSATSVFMPHLDLEDTCALLRRNGYDGLELRVRYFTGDPKEPPSPWGRHITDVSPDNFGAKAASIKSTLKAHGLRLVAIASNASALELDVIRKLAEGAAAAGCPLVRVGAPRRYTGEVNYLDLFAEAVTAFEKAIEITRANGVRCMIEIHGGTIFVSASLAHRLLSRFDPADIGVIYDPQNMVSDGYETTPMALDLLGDYLAHVHGARRGSRTRTARFRGCIRAAGWRKGAISTPTCCASCTSASMQVTSALRTSTASGRPSSA